MCSLARLRTVHAQVSNTHTHVYINTYMKYTHVHERTHTSIHYYTHIHTQCRFRFHYLFRALHFNDNAADDARVHACDSVCVEIEKELERERERERERELEGERERSRERERKRERERERVCVCVCTVCNSVYVGSFCIDMLLLVSPPMRTTCCPCKRPCWGRTPPPRPPTHLPRLVRSMLTSSRRRPST